MSKFVNCCIKHSRNCAFCKYWYDPTNASIMPSIPKANIWSYDKDSTNICLVRNVDMMATSVCKKYECKLEILR